MINYKTTNIGGTRLSVKKRKSKYVPNTQPIVGYKETLSRLAYAVKTSQSVLMIGETGVGKTALIRHLANKTKSGMRRLNLNGQTTVDEFVGKILLNKEGTYWVDGILTEALREGYWLLLDEINAAAPEILFVLHSLLDDDHYIVLSEKDGEIVRPHENFRLFASMNPSGKYAGTKDLNKAFLSRFPMVLKLDFPEPETEKRIIRTYAKKIDDKIINNLVKVAGNLRTSYKKDEIEFVCSTRDLINCALIAENRGIKEALELSIKNRCQEEDLAAVNTVIKLYFGTEEKMVTTADFRDDKREAQVKRYLVRLDKLKERIGKIHKEAHTLRDKVNGTPSISPPISILMTGTTTSSSKPSKAIKPLKKDELVKEVEKYISKICDFSDEGEKDISYLKSKKFLKKT